MSAAETRFNRVARLAMTNVQRLRRAWWWIARPHVRGAQAVVLTPGGRLVLVEHRYLRGLHVPGGGVKRGETPADAILRELREEIGLTGHGTVRLIDTLVERRQHRTVEVTLFLVEDATYAWRPSLEIMRVIEMPLDTLQGRPTAARDRIARARSAFPDAFTRAPLP